MNADSKHRIHFNALGYSIARDGSQIDYRFMFENGTTGTHLVVRTSSGRKVVDCSISKSDLERVLEAFRPRDNV